MRLTCPNCGAEYETPEGLIPAGGKHVQCTACHTRWFARGPHAATTEDQILARLESRGARPRPTLVMVPEPEPEPTMEAEPVPASPRPIADTAKPTATPDPAAPTTTPDEPAPPKAPALVLTPAATREEDPQPPRDTGRLRLDAVTPDRPAPPAASRFGRGFLVAFILVALAVAAYVWRAPLAATAPDAGPVLEAYGSAIDAARDWLDQRLSPTP